MAGMLATGIERHLPGVPFRVLDFGLTPAQAAFLQSKGLLAARPAGLDTGHPYALKSELARFLSPEPDATIVWLDCDMIVVGDCRRDLENVVAGMAATGRSVAACRDRGAASIGRFLKSFPSPALAEAISENDRDAPYFNIGLTIFRGRDFLDAWPALSRRHEAANDFCFEQNAFNVWVGRNPAEFLELDARQWNVHGPLLARAALTANGVSCDGTNVHILHPTSPDCSEHKEEQVTLAVGALSFPAWMKWFRNVELRGLQADCLSAFLRGNYADLVKFGVLAADEPDPRYTRLALPRP